MRRFYQAIVNNPKKILLIFVLIAIIGGFFMGMVSVNYDITDYLPDNAPSTISLDKMQEEFDGGIPNARVMVPNITIPQALEYKEKLLNCEGVTAVTWLDDAADILQPIETMDEDTVENYYKDNNALFTVTVAEGQQVEAVEAMRAAVGEQAALSGNAVATAVATTSTVNEIMLITIIGVVFVFLVLILTTTS